MRLREVDPSFFFFSSFFCGKVGPKSRPTSFKGSYSLHNNSICAFLLGLQFSFNPGHLK